MICPHCNNIFSLYDGSGYQVNDHFELTFCSYDCSLDYTMLCKDELKHLSDDVILEGI